MILCITITLTLLIISDDGKFVCGASSENLLTLRKRTLDRFRLGNIENERCWDRRPEEDSFYSIIDTHNHFHPFGGPAVPFNDYIQWMEEAGILFSTMFGIGQLIQKKNQEDPDCCYYLHCPTFDYLVVPDPSNDRKNAKDYVKYKQNTNQTSKIHLTLSATFPNLQKPENITTILEELENDFPNAFNWVGEVNLIKHALVGNGFFKRDSSPRITKQFLDNGNLDPFFRKMEKNEWPVTLHCDFGCDNYDAIPPGALDNNPIKNCHVPKDEIELATQEHKFWEGLLGEFYPAFFNKITNEPNLTTFKKIQHLQLMDVIMTRYPKMKIVWAHMGLSKELKSLHPRVHTHILEYFFKKHEYLYVDLSWDILAKLLLLNYDEMQGVENLSANNHPDIHDTELNLWNGTHITRIEAIRKTMHEKWETMKDLVHTSGSKMKLTGPTHAFVIYLDLIEKYSDRFLTGTDFVSSMGSPEKYPGLQSFKDPPSGCMKDQVNHRRQVTDTSAINIFFNDEVFQKVVLGENYFKLTGLDSEFAPPKMCDSLTGGGSSTTIPFENFEKSVLGLWMLKWVMNIFFFILWI